MVSEFDPLPQQIGGSTRGDFGDPENVTFVEKTIEFRVFYTATVGFTYFLKTQISKNITFLVPLVPGYHFKLVKVGLLVHVTQIVTTRE